MTNLRAVSVGLDPSLVACAPEIKYALRTLLRLAGVPYRFMWVGGADAGKALDIYYGRRGDDVAASVRIDACGTSFSAAPSLEPRELLEENGIPFLEFGNGGGSAYRHENNSLVFVNDIVFACYWLLTGAREPNYPRDRWDNLHLEGSFFLENSLTSKPLVSIYGSLLREHFEKLDYAPLDLPWASRQGDAAFVFSHDVDYPQMIRWIECLRLLRTRGLKALGSIAGVMRGTNHFWKFSDWLEYEQKFGTYPAFYFQARQGSLLEYARGNPDSFYDIRAPELHLLFAYLRSEGCEVGLHSSFNAYRSAAQLRQEKQLLEEVSGTPIEGNRHHYWHLDPLEPHETLSKHEKAGLLYDSSLAFEFYPGFRRGICHPFHVFNPNERRELDIVELPPAWMDDHFDRRLLVNKIGDPEGFARQLVEVARATGGAIVVDYHVRGMNHDFYPRYGPWLMEFVKKHLGSSVSFCSPRELARKYIEYEKSLSSHSQDATDSRTIHLDAAGSKPGKRMSGSITVDTLQAGEEQCWEDFVATNTYGNVYHTLAWKVVTEEGLGHRPVYLRALDASGKFAGILPLFLVKGLFGRRLVSVPMRDRGGVLADDRKTASLLIARAIELTRELDCKYLELRSLEEIDPSVTRENGLRCERHWITTRVDLSLGTDRLWNALDRNAVRWAINKARKEGVRIEIDNTEEGLDTFYEMFIRTRRSLGIPPFPKSLFVSIWQHLITHGKANLFLVWKDSDPINGMINLLSKDTFIPAYAAPQNRWRKYYPSDFMIWHTIEWAAKQGFRIYDFGADSSHQTGLLWFKKKWGGVQHPMYYHYYLNGTDSLPSFDSSSPTYTLLRKVWAGLPAPMCKHLGNWVSKQLS